MFCGLTGLRAEPLRRLVHAADRAMIKGIAVRKCRGVAGNSGHWNAVSVAEHEAADASLVLPNPCIMADDRLHPAMQNVARRACTCEGATHHDVVRPNPLIAIRERVRHDNAAPRTRDGNVELARSHCVVIRRGCTGLEREGGDHHQTYSGIGRMQSRISPAHREVPMP